MNSRRILLFFCPKQQCVCP